MGLDINPARKVSSLSVAAQQRVEIAKALAIDAKVVVMDEPTAPLTESEVDDLFKLIDDLRSNGIAVLYISHRLDEIVRIADRVTVIRDGEVVQTLEGDEIQEREIVRLMVGREIENLYPRAEAQAGDVVLRVEGFLDPACLTNAHSKSAPVRSSASRAWSGPDGPSWLARCSGPTRSRPVRFRSMGTRSRSSPPGCDCRRHRLPDRGHQREGLAQQLPVAKHHPARTPESFRMIDRGRERRTAEQRRQELDIRTPSIRQRVESLSGGNQQKVVVAKWLETEARVLIFDEPARGIDVGAKAELFRLTGDLAGDGRAGAPISSYLPELINMCDRILVLRDRRIAGDVKRSDFSQERLVHWRPAPRLRRLHEHQRRRTSRPAWP